MSKLEVDIDSEMSNEFGEDDSSDDESEPDYGGLKCPECGRSKNVDWSKYFLGKYYHGTTIFTLTNNGKAEKMVGWSR